MFFKRLLNNTNKCLIIINYSSFFENVPFILTHFLHSMMLLSKFGKKKTRPVVLEKKSKWFWRRSRKKKKFTDRQIDDGQRMFRKAYLGFQLRWVKNNIVNIVSTILPKWLTVWYFDSLRLNKREKKRVYHFNVGTMIKKAIY